MARGTLYEIQQNLEDIGNVSEDDFFDYTGHEFDYIKEIDDSPSEVEEFLNMLRTFGMPVGYIHATIPYFDVTDEGKKTYFEGAFSKLKKMVDKMSLESFMTDQTSWELRECIDDTYGDAVTSADCEFQTLDRFIRNASGRYYVGKIFLMH